MGNLIKILIENYDRSAKKYVLANQEICKVSIEDLKQIIEQIQKLPDENNQFPPRVITDDYIFSKKGKEIWYRGNHINTLFGIPQAPSDLKVYLELKHIFKSKITHAYGYLDHLIFPLMLFFMLLLATIRYFFESYRFKYYYIILFWTDFLGVFSIPHILFRKMQEIPVRYSYPFKYDFQPLNVSYLIMSISILVLFFVLILLGPLTLPEIPLEELISSVGLVIVVGLLFAIGGISSLVYNHRKAKFSKEKRLHNLYELIQSLPIEQKIYLSQFIVKAEDLKVTTTGFLSKLIICISLLMSIIPLFTAF